MAGLVIASGQGNIRQLAPRNVREPPQEFREFGVRPLTSSSSGRYVAPEVRRAEPAIRSQEPKAEPPADAAKGYPYNEGRDSR